MQNRLIMSQLSAIATDAILSPKQKCEQLRKMFHFNPQSPVSNISHLMATQAERSSLEVGSMYLSVLDTLLLNDASLAPEIFSQLSMPMHVYHYKFIELVARANKGLCEDIYLDYFFLLIELQKNGITQREIYNLLRHNHTDHHYQNAESKFLEFLEEIFSDDKASIKEILLTNCEEYHAQRNFLQHVAAGKGWEVIQSTLIICTPLPDSEVSPFWSNILKRFGEERAYRLFLNYLFDHPNLQLSYQYTKVFNKSKLLQILLKQNLPDENSTNLTLRSAQYADTLQLLNLALQKEHSLGNFFWVKRGNFSEPDITKGSLSKISDEISRITIKIAQLKVDQARANMESHARLFQQRKRKTKVAEIKEPEEDMVVLAAVKLPIR